MNLSDCVSPTYSVNIPIINRGDDWKNYLKDRCKDKIKKIERQYPDNRDLLIDWTDVLSFGELGTNLSDDILQDPDKAIGDISGALNEIIKLKHPGLYPINIRIVNCIKKTQIRDMRSHHLGTFVTIEGIVRKITEVRPRITTAVYRCQAGHATRTTCGYGPISEPSSCSSPGCNYKKFELVLRQCSTIDSQKIRIQESPEGLRGGEQPQTLDIDLTDTLCGIINPGDRVTLNGTVRGIQRTSSGQKSSTIDIYLECNSIEISEKEFSEVTYSEEDIDQIKALAATKNVHNEIARSIAPTIFGTDLFKQAIALQMFGGVTKNMPDGSRTRGDIHVLIMGDPGIAKSQILRYVSTISPRAILTSGMSASKAGLTATAVNDEFGDGRWTLEAGALVLADMGMACVDEMDKMEKNDRSALHEAMEQQTISVAKAGITASLKSRCCILGAANPKHGRFDNSLDLAQQIEMGAALLSRFDIIILATDVPESKKDKKLSSHVLKSHFIGESIAQHDAGISRNKPDVSAVKPPIEPELFRKYVAYAKKNVFPKMNQASMEVIQNHYCKIRDQGGENKPVPVTVRQLEAVIRLAEASARMRLSNEVTIFDARLAIDLSDQCMTGVYYDPETGVFDVDKTETGTSKDNRDIATSIEEVVRMLSETGPASEEQVVKIVVSRGHEPHKVDRVLTTMKGNGGTLTSPRNGILKVI